MTRPVDPTASTCQPRRTCQTINRCAVPAKERPVGTKTADKKAVDLRTAAAPSVQKKR